MNRTLGKDSAEGSRPIRVGAVVYLNAQPLVYCLDRLASRVDVVTDVPSRLADGLAAGRLDVAIIPSIEFLRQPGSRIVSDACIACDGPVLSVKLFSRVPMDRIRRLALDEGSRTSAVLARILLCERFGLKPELQILPLDVPPAACDTDAVVVIGDRAIRAPADAFCQQWDLGEQWTLGTGLPFVFALWVARPNVALDPIDRVLSMARDAGLGRLEEIARRSAAGVGLSEVQCLSYLRDHLHFHLGRREQQGLRRFFDLAARHGLAPQGGEIVFHHRHDP